jgi:gamma-glutamyltranspeptidase/glutathione hydrolase
MLGIMTGPRRRLALATPHWAATEAGRAAFADGGTAVDAALAACATLTVVYPHMCSIGGDAIALVQVPDGTVTAVNGSGAAPAALDAARVRAALERDPAPVTRTGMPVRGPHTVTVPGVLAAWETLRQLGGRLPLARLLRPAIGFAADGCPVSRSLAATLIWEPDVLAADPGLREIYFCEARAPGRVRPLAEGEIYRQPALAASLDDVAHGGTDVFYGGELGARYVAGLRATGSVMMPEDLTAHATEVLEPLRGVVFGHEFLTAPPNSQGFLLIQLLAAMERLDTAPPDPLGSRGDALAHLFRLTSDDRDRHLCDPRTHDVPLGELLDEEHVRWLTERSGGADVFAAGDRASTRPSTHPDGASSGDTIACVAADTDGWAVSVIQSIYHGFGAAILEPSTGIVAHDRGACFSLEPKSPNLIAGGKRPLHTLMPVMVRREGRLAIVAGTMGGEAQPQIHAEILARLLRGGTGGLTAAVAAPRWIYDEGAILAEASVPAACLAALRSTGMPIELLEAVDESVGHAQYVRIAGGGELEAASDPRADGTGIVTPA